jgi:hypothetical protein
MRTPPRLRQELKRRRSLEPSGRRAVSNLPSPAGSPQWEDLIAFVAVLATGVLLIVLGHLTATEVTTVCAAIVGLYAAWRRFR